MNEGHLNIPAFAPITALQMVPSGKLLIKPQETPKLDAILSEPVPQSLGQENGPQALKMAVPTPSPGTLQSKPENHSQASHSSVTCLEETPKAKTLPPRLKRESTPGPQSRTPGTPRHGLTSWGVGLAIPQGPPFPGTKTSAQENGPGSSVTLPKARNPSNPRDSLQLARRHHSQPQAYPGHFSHMGSREIRTLQIAGLPEVGALAEPREEPEKMEMEEQLPAGRKESEKGPQADLEEVDLGSKPPTPPLHRFPSWVRRGGG